MEQVLECLDEGVLVTDRTYTVREANGAAREILETDDPLRQDVRDLVPRSVEATFHEAFDGERVSADSLSVEEYYPALGRWLQIRTEPLSTRDNDADGDEDDTGADRAVLAVIVEDVSAQTRSEQRLETQTQELETVTRIVGIFETIIEELTEASDRSAIEQYVCEQLGESDLYDLAWVSNRNGGTDTLERRAVAGGVGEQMVEAVLDSSAASEGSLEQRAYDTGDLQVGRSLSEGDDLPQSVRRVAFAQGYEVGLAVPFLYGNTVYGVLSLYTRRENAFQAHEQTSFAALGTAIGYAINAVKQERLLLSDTVTELTFHTTDGSLARLARSLETDVRLRGVVPRDGAELSAYAEFSDGQLDTVTDQATGADDIHSVRVVNSYDSGGVVQLEFGETSLPATVVSYGGTIRAAEFGMDGGEVVTEFAPSDDLDEVVETVTDGFDGTRLVAKVEHEAPAQTAAEFKNDLQEKLTDRQETVLRTSYHADYFENPRGSTGEDVAESLGVTGPTFHHHLRAAQRKLLGAFFDNTQPRREEVEWGQ